MAILGQTECFCRPISCLQHLRKWGPVDVRADKQSQHVGITHQIISKPSQVLPQQSLEPETASLYLTDFAWAWCHQRHHPHISALQKLSYPQYPEHAIATSHQHRDLERWGNSFSIPLRMEQFGKYTFKNKPPACPGRLSNSVPLVGHPPGKGN